MLFKTDDIGIDKVLVPKKESYGTNESFKYFIGYSDDDDIHPLCIKLPQMLNALKIIIKQCLLRSAIKKCWKNILKYGKKLVT